MAAKGYCTVADVEALLGVSLTAAQQAQCDVLIERMETFVDAETGRGWLVGTQTDEAHCMGSDHLFLRYVPVVSVVGVSGRSGVGGAELPLVADLDYAVVDLGNGYIKLVASWRFDRVLVSYEPVDVVPADLQQACIEIVANWLQPSLNPGSFGLDSYSLPDLTVRFARSHVQQVVPPLARRVIERYRWPVHG